MDNRDTVRDAILTAMMQLRNKSKPPQPRQETAETLGGKLVRSLTNPLGPDQAPTNADWAKGILGR